PGSTSQLLRREPVWMEGDVRRGRSSGPVHFSDPKRHARARPVGRGTKQTGEETDGPKSVPRDFFTSIPPANRAQSYVPTSIHDRFVGGVRLRADRDHLSRAERVYAPGCFAARFFLH